LIEYDWPGTLKGCECNNGEIEGKPCCRNSIDCASCGRNGRNITASDPKELNYW